MAGGISLGSATARIIIEAGDALKSIKQVEEGLTGLRRSTLESSNVQGLGAGMAGFGAAVAAGFGVAINTAANFEQAMDGVGASLGGVDTAAGVTRDTFTALEAEALRIGSSTSKSAMEAAQAMDLMAKAGVDAETILNGGAQAAVNLSEATGESLATSAETTASALALFSDQGYSTGQVADFLTTAMNNSRASMSELQTGLSNLSPVIANTGMGLDEAGAALAFFNSRGVPAARVGTGLATAFRMVSAPTDEAAQAMRDLGISAFDAQGNFVGFPALFDQVQTATAGMTEQQRSAALALIFGAEAADVMAIAAKEGGDGVRALTDDMNVAGSAAESSAARLDNFSGSLEQFKGAIETALIVIGTQLLPIARQVVDAATSMVEAFLALPSGVQTAIAAMIGIAGALSLAGGGFILLAPRILNTINAVRQLAVAFPVLGKAIAGLGAASPWILAIVAAIALLGLAYKTNFLGFADLVDGVVSRVRDAVGTFRTFYDALRAGNEMVPGIGRIAAAFTALSHTIQLLTGFDLSGPINAAYKATMRLVNAFRKIGKQFGKAFEELLDGDFDAMFDRLRKGFAGIGDALAAPAKAVGDFLKSIETGFAPLDRVIREAANVWTGFGRLIQEVFQGDFRGALEVAQRLTGDFFDLLQNTGSLAWEGMRAGIGAIGDALGSVDWDAVLNGAQDLAGRAIGAFGDLATGVWDWIRTAASGVPWSDIISGAAGLAASAILAFGDLATGVWHWVSNAAGEIPWLDIVAGAAGLAAQAIVTFGDLATGVWNWVSHAAGQVSWADLIAGAAGLAAQAIVLFGDLATGVWNWVNHAAGQVDWASLIAGAAGLAAMAILAFGDLATGVFQWVSNAAVNVPWLDIISGAAGLAAAAIVSFGNLIQGVQQWVINAAGNVPWLDIIAGAAGLAARAILAFGDLATGVWHWVNNAITNLDIGSLDLTILTSVGTALLQGLLDGWDALKPVLTAYASGLPGFVAGLVTGAGTALVQVGRDLIQGVITGWDELGWSTLWTNATNLASWVASLIVDAGQYTIQKGRDMVQGVIDGINERGHEIAEALISYLELDPMEDPTQQTPEAEQPLLKDGSQRQAPMQLPGNIRTMQRTIIPPPDTAAFDTAINGLKATVDRAMTAATAAARSGTSAMGAAVTAGFAQMVSDATSRMATYTAAVTQGMSRSQSAATSGSAAMASAVTSRIAAMVATASGQLSAFTGRVSGAFAQVVSIAASTMGQVPGIVSRALASAASGAFGAGANIGNSFAAGMRSTLGAIQSAASAMVAAAQTAVEARALIGSPSKLFRKEGRWMGEGAVLGVLDMLPAMARASSMLVDAGAANARRQWSMQSLMSAPASSFAANAGNGTHVTYIYNNQDQRTIQQLSPPQLLQLMRDALAGAEFAREFDEETDRD